MEILRKLPLYSASDLRYLCELLIPFTEVSGLMYGNNFCPFHLNWRTPAASLFKDADGIERLYCYSCKRQYTSYDYITKVLEKKPLDYLLKVTTKEGLDKLLEHKIDRFALETSKLEFSTIEQLLIDVYNFEEALPI